MEAGQSPVQGQRGSEQSERLDWVAPECLPALSLRFCIGKCVEPAKTDVPHSPPAQPLPRPQGAPNPSQASHPPCGTWHPPTQPPHHPAKQVVVPSAEPPSQPEPARHQEPAVIHHEASCQPRVQRITRIRRVYRLPFKMFCAPRWTSPSPGTTTTITGPPNHPASAQECPAILSRASGQARRARRAGRSHGHTLRGSPHVTQWLNNFFALPLSVSPLLNASLSGGTAGGRAPQTLEAGISPQDSDRTRMENPQI